MCSPHRHMALPRGFIQQHPCLQCAARLCMQCFFPFYLAIVALYCLVAVFVALLVGAACLCVNYCTAEGRSRVLLTRTVQ